MSQWVAENGLERIPLSPTIPSRINKFITIVYRLLYRFGFCICEGADFRLRLVLFAFALLPLESLSQAKADPVAPTQTNDPATIDRVWQTESSKYDSSRNAILKQVDKVNTEGPFRTEWESLQTYKVPDWYKDAKFGIFIHWGVYSVPAFGSEWYPRQMYLEGTEEYKHHIATYGTQDKFGYKDFVPMFKAEKFDPAAWARLFKEAGAKYVVPVFEHHDGFTMYESGLSDWTAVKMGPHRDLIGDLGKAVRADRLRRYPHKAAAANKIKAEASSTCFRWRGT